MAVKIAVYKGDLGCIAIEVFCSSHNKWSKKTADHLLLGDIVSTSSFKKLLLYLEVWVFEDSLSKARGNERYF